MDNHYLSEDESIEHGDGKFRSPSEPSRNSSNSPHPPQSTQILGLFSPLRFLIIMVGGIFLAEVVAMILVYRFRILPYYLQTIIDASTMVVMIFPLIYFLSLKPLIRHNDERRRVEDALRKSEERFARAFHSSPAALTISRLIDGGLIDVNEGFLELSGYKREEVIGHTSIELGLYVNPQERENLTQQLLTKGRVRGYEATARVKSGELRTVSMSIEGIELEGEACILGSITDITERKRSHERLQRLNRSLKVLSKCNEVLVRSESETELLDNMCEIIVDVGGYKMAWVGFAEQDSEKSVRPVSQYGFENGYLTRAKITWDDTERGRGPTGSAIRTGGTQVNQNFLTNPNTAPWRTSAMERGYQSSIALPLRGQQATLGALTIYSDVPDAFDREEVDQLNELAADMAYGISALRDRAERKRAEEQLREMALFPAFNPGAVLQVDAKGVIRKTNPAGFRLGLYSEAQLTERIPDLRELDIEHCITSELTLQVPETRLYDRTLFWTVRGAAELGVAFLYSTDITELKRAEDAIHRLSLIVEQTNDTVVVTDRNGVIEYVNPSFERLTGYMRPEILGLTPRVLKSGLHNVRFYRELWDTILRGEVFIGEIANCKKNGELFYEMKTISPLRDAQGNITHFVATGKDITRHKLDEEKLRKAYDELEQRVRDRTEELQIANSELEDEINIRRQVEVALRESEQRLKRAQEIAHLGSWELDLENNQLTWSDEVYRIFGLQPQEFSATYEAFLEAVYPDDRAAVDAAYSGSIAEGRDHYEIEHRTVRRSSGELRFVHEKCEHLRNEAGRIIRSVGMVHDITERKQAEKLLASTLADVVKERNRLLAVMETLPVGVAILDSHGGGVLTNRAYEQVWGGPRPPVDSVDDYSAYKAWWAETGQLVQPEEWASAQAVQKGEVVIGQLMQIERFDGHRAFVLNSGAPIFDDQGQIIGSAVAIMDITEQKQAEEALKKAHDELELRVQERTWELSNEISERKEIERQLRIRTTAMEAAANGIIITDPQGIIQWANPALNQISGYDPHDLIGQGMNIFKSGSHDADHYAEMWSTILSGRVWQGEMVNRRKDGSLYVEEQTITPVLDENDQIPHFIAIKQDVTERKEAAEQLEKRNVELQLISAAEHEQRQLAEALVGAALVLNRSLRLEEVLALLLEQIEGVIPYQLASIALLDGESFYDASHRGNLGLSEIPVDINRHFPLDEFPLLKNMRISGEPVLIVDTQKEPDWIIVQGLETCRSVLSAPLLVEKNVIGFVNLFTEKPGYFTRQMSDRLVAFAAHAAVAIQNAWLFEQVQAGSERLQSLSRRLVEIQENERLYISRELHDEAGQVLTSLMVDLRLLEKRASEPKAILKIVAEMENSLNAVSESLHRIAMDLRPASLDHVGLVAAIRQHLEAIGEKNELKVNFRSGKVRERLQPNVETVLYRIVQEALTNIVRHARATRVDVVLTVRDDHLIVIVEDDGIGFDPDSVSAGEHLGLFGMRERTEMIGGKLTIESAPGKGTTIMVEVNYADTINDRR